MVTCATSQFKTQLWIAVKPLGSVSAVQLTEPCSMCGEMNFSSANVQPINTAIRSIFKNNIYTNLLSIYCIWPSVESPLLQNIHQCGTFYS